MASTGYYRHDNENKREISVCNLVKATHKATKIGFKRLGRVGKI